MGREKSSNLLVCLALLAVTVLSLSCSDSGGQKMVIERGGDFRVNVSVDGKPQPLNQALIWRVEIEDARVKDLLTRWNSLRDVPLIGVPARDRIGKVIGFEVQDVNDEHHMNILALNPRDTVFRANHKRVTTGEDLKSFVRDLYARGSGSLEFQRDKKTRIVEYVVAR